MKEFGGVNANNSMCTVITDPWQCPITPPLVWRGVGIGPRTVPFIVLPAVTTMAGETGGGDRGGPSPPGPINFISWVRPGDPIYNKMGHFYFSWTVFQQLQKLYRWFWTL